jgi:riboflavin biosynthesis pyrimidine reductase
MPPTPPPPPGPEQPITLHPLLPPGPPATAQRIVESFGLHLPRAAAMAVTPERARTPEGAITPGGPITPAAPLTPPARPRVLLNMVSTIDGRATIGGRSGPIGGPADRELFHALRTVVDAVLVGAGTARAEHYRTLVREASSRTLRRERGLQEQPLACIVSGRLELEADNIPLLSDPQARVAILTASQASLPEARPLGETGAQVSAGGQKGGDAPMSAGAQIDYIRAAAHGHLDLPCALAQLQERFAIGTVLCEGGPHLNTQLLAAGLVDELFLTLGPLLAGGGSSSSTGEALRILAGADFDPPVELDLLSVLKHESHLFLRYAVSAAGPLAVEAG